MRRFLSGLLTALDAVVIVGLGYAVALVPATIIWGIQFGFAADFSGFARFSSNIWLLGHGVDVTVQLDSGLAAFFGIAGGATSVRVSIALLGIGLLTAQLSLRAGRRAALADDPLASYLSAIVVTALLSALITFTAASPLALPSRPQGILLPTLVVAAAMAFAIDREQSRLGAPVWREAVLARVRWTRIDPVLRRDIVAALAGAAAVVGAILTVAGLALAVALAGNYAAVVGVYQSLQAGVLGGIIVTLVQLIVLPNLVVWAASWIVGAGFSIGAGTAVSPGGTVLGAIPALPVFSAIPQAPGVWAFAVLLVPITAGFLIAMFIRQRHDAFSSPARSRVIFGLAGMLGLASGIMLGLLAWWSAGAIGPGRMLQVGPSGLAVLLWTTLTVGLGAVVGGYAGRATASK
ncbi:MAG: DUF6350 family protein [Agromyces sp.]